jgi:hypothetical protein
VDYKLWIRIGTLIYSLFDYNHNHHNHLESLSTGRSLNHLEHLVNSFCFLSALRAVTQPLPELLLVCITDKLWKLASRRPKSDCPFSQFVLCVTIDMCLLQSVTVRTAVSATSSVSVTTDDNCKPLTAETCLCLGYFEHVTVYIYIHTYIHTHTHTHSPILSVGNVLVRNLPWKRIHKQQINF